MMGASRTWRIPVRGRFTFRPNEEPHKVRGGYVPRPMVQGKPVGEEILEKDSCYMCGKRGGRHERGCPRFF